MATNGRSPRPSPVFELLDRLDVDVDVGAVLRWDDGAVQVVRVDHRAHDGLSAAETLLREAGYRARPPARRLAASGTVRWREWPAIWNRFRVDFRDRRVPWRHETEVAGRIPPLTPDDENFGWIEWDADASATIADACERRGISVNALLLWGLQQAVRPLVRDEVSSLPWIMPVDLRRRGRAAATEAVATSGVMLDIGLDDTPEQVDAQIVRKVKERSYLAYWWVTERVPRLLPRAVLWPVLRGKELGGNRCAGGCTYLGDLSAWVEAPPAGRRIASAVPFNLLSRQFPVQSVGLQWDGKLTFSLRLHPMLAAGAATPFVERWRDVVETEIAAPRPGRTHHEP